MRGALALKMAIGFTLFDVVFTLRFWHWEANPIVIILGRVRFVVVKLFLVWALAFIWIKFRGAKIQGLLDFVVWLYVVIIAGAALYNINQVWGLGF